MVMRAMGGRWTTYIIKLSCFLLLILVLVQGCSSLNPEGLALLDFRARVSHDPYDAFASWNHDDYDPCSWSNVHCVDGDVNALDLNGLSLEGVLAPEIAKLTHLRRLILSRNHFYGVIPKELGELQMLEVLDLRDNNLSGELPSELGKMCSLKRLLLCNNKLEGTIPTEIGSLNSIYELQFDENIKFVAVDGIGFLNRKFGRCFRFHKISSKNCGVNRESSLEQEMVQDNVNVVRRKLAEQPANLAAPPAPKDASAPDHIIALPSSRSSGSFPAVPKDKKKHLAPAPSPVEVAPKQESSKQNALHHTPESQTNWKLIIGIVCGVFLLIVIIILLFVCQSRAVKNIGPWRSGLSGQLQKAFVTGVPKLNRTELETACEDFSNIIETKEGCTLYKGTLSSGVEICVVSTTITCFKDWSKRAELGFRKKIDVLSRVNHKNFANLIGYCEEDEPFVRMMVFEYAPNGSLSEHLHDKDLEHLDWSSRMRIIMGTAYCLQTMHELNPPVAHTHLNSSMIYLTDDYAAKVAELSFWREFLSKPKVSDESCELPPLADTETNVYCFGIALLEIISGKLPYSEDHVQLVDWASQYLSDKCNIHQMIDPTLQSFNENELLVVFEVIQDCIQQEPRKRPTMNEVISKLRQVIDISPEKATPRTSPLWWAELEILSSEAA